ncbi:SH3 domain-containing protein [Leptospira sp. 85282-16]|uniref:SH3 domain-containing protein n=1 Tax=Leptospira sp. 85282-16 TaxID=2971256 RepID=UPI0021BF93FB|nr:SH3 domain-containing protein [Leptospira sp. 85282-16]MCT8335869.1 SH3 domain-containing protein [Leptospira sp. 85282-16]
MKKILIIIIGTTFFFNYCKKSNNEKNLTIIKPIKMIVNANGGLRIRKLPDINSEKIGLIPDGSVIESYGDVLQEMAIDGKNGKWMKIKHYDIVGYSFSGFLIHEDAFTNPIENEKTISGFRKLIPSFEKIDYDSEKDKRTFKLTENTGTVTFDSTIGIYRVISISPGDSEDEFNNYNFIFKENKLIFSDMNMFSLGLPKSFIKYKVVFQKSFGCATECDEYVQTENYEYAYISNSLMGETNYNSKTICSNKDGINNSCPVCSKSYKNESYTFQKKWIANLDGSIKEVIYEDKSISEL